MYSEPHDTLVLSMEIVVIAKFPRYTKCISIRDYPKHPMPDRKKMFLVDSLSGLILLLSELILVSPAVLPGCLRISVLIFVEFFLVSFRSVLRFHI